jgi:ABC-2 type transport system ATP-binding protein
MVVVSHDIDMIKELCTRGVVLRKGHVVFDGPIDEAVVALAAA